MSSEHPVGVASASSKSVLHMDRLSKKYAIYDRPSLRLWELMTLRRNRLHREFWALQDISLEVSAGTTLAIIGQNGSGKSTLLQIVAGILTPTRGRCSVHGRISALLELGSGFNPEFTGRENIFMNGAILNLTHHEVHQRLPSILEFAEIGEFIDQPVKTYSSGMFLRLAFAVAIHVDPDILLVDEALAVGDLVFQHRCINRIRRLRNAGKTILFVTHDLQAVTQFCDRAILLDGGHKIEDGDPEDVVQRYRALMFERERKAIGIDPERVALQQDGSLPVVNTIPYIHHRYGAGGAEIMGILLHSADGSVLNQAKPHQEVRLLISVRFHRSIQRPIIGFTVRDRLGAEVTASNTSYEDLQLPAAQVGDVFNAGFRIKIPALRPGSYTISPAIAQGTVSEHTIEDWIDNAYVIDITTDGLVYGLMRWSVEASFNVISKS